MPDKGGVSLMLPPQKSHLLLSVKKLCNLEPDREVSVLWEKQGLEEKECKDPEN